MTDSAAARPPPNLTSTNALTSLGAKLAAGQEGYIGITIDSVHTCDLINNLLTIYFITTCLVFPDANAACKAARARVATVERPLNNRTWI